MQNKIYEDEIWVVIEGFDDYLVSSYGRLKNKKTGRILKQQLYRGYCRINLLLKGKHCTKKVHRLVAKAFLENFKEDYEVHHKDFIRHNNHKDNLASLPSIENRKIRTKGLKRDDTRLKILIFENLLKSIRKEKIQSTEELIAFIKNSEALNN